MIKLLLARLPRDVLRDADGEIARRVLAMPEWQDAPAVFCYYSTGDEVDTKALMQAALRAGKTLALPRCEGKGQMDFYKVASLERLIPGKYDIPVPPKDAEKVFPEKGDFAVVPCIACDSRGARLGRGGGYYDRWLADSPVFSAALCYHALLLPALPAEPFDRKTDCIVTEKGELRSSAG